MDSSPSTRAFRRAASISSRCTTRRCNDGSNTAWPARPRSLARYMAASASRMSDSALPVSEDTTAASDGSGTGDSAMPMLAVMTSAAPPTSNGARS